jgi:exopolyphosphatase
MVRLLSLAVAAVVPLQVTAGSATQQQPQLQQHQARDSVPQIPFYSDHEPPSPDFEEGVGHFSEWSKSQKRRFIDAVRSGDDALIANWTVVMGNEGGDLDSMTSALTWAYHLDHVHQPDAHDHARTVALLQTPEDALDLRPENKLALSNANMSPGHRDLLTIDELPMTPEELSKKIKGIIIVDHPLPRSVWSQAKVLSIFDHHTDRGVAPDAKPRLFGRTASCSTLVAKKMLDERAKAGKDHEYHLPHELLELIL